MPFNQLGEWEPNPKQEQLIQVPFSVKEAGYLGGAGSGKTELLLMLPLVYDFIAHASFKQLFLRRTKPEIRNEVWPRSFEIYPKFGGRPNETFLTWEFPSGAMIFFGHCEHEKDVHQYDSMQINLFTPDEVTSLTEFIYLYIALQRTRSADPKLPAIVRCSGMPGGVGHTWVNKRFVKPAPKGGVIIVGKGGLKRIMIHATQSDNKRYIDPNYQQSLEAIPNEAERQAKLFGSFDAYLGQVFDEFRDKKYPDEPDNALHVIKAFDIPDWWPRIVVGDWGYEAYTWIGYGAISPDGRLYVYREQVYRRTKIEAWAPYVKQYIEKENPRIVKFCRSARQNRGQEHTIEQQINDALGVNIELSDNSPGARIAGKQLLHEYLRWQPKPKIVQDKSKYDDTYATWLLRNRSLKEYNSYLDSFIEQPEEIIPKIQIFEDCEFLITAIKACNYDEKNVEDVAPFEGDDAYDGIRMMVDTADRFAEEAKDEYEMMKKREEIVQKFNQEQDMHQFYMAHRALEGIKGNSIAVPRLHGMRGMRRRH